MDRIEIEDFLRTVEPFDVLATDVLGALVDCAVARTLPKDHLLLEEGGPGDALYVVVQGRVQVRVRDNGRPRRVAFLTAGDMVGEMALLTGEPRTADVVTDTPTTVLEIDREAFYDVCEHDPEVAHFLTELLGKRLRAGGQISQLGNYQVLDEIGRGGMGIVFAGYHPRLRRSVAIKMLDHAHVFDERFAAQFAAESAVVAGLNHPNIVQVFDHHAAYGTQFIVMEMIDGPTLADVLQVRGTLDEAETRRIVLQVAAALQHAHARGITHRDIKPENVMLPRDGGPIKLMDFGIAGPVVDHDDDPIGTPGYMAPEQERGDPIDERVDVYPLGVMAFELLTGERPFFEEEGLTLLEAKERGDLPDVRDWRPEISDAMRAFIRRCTWPDPDRRFPDCGAVLAHFGDGPHLVRPGVRARSVMVVFDPAEAEAVGDAIDRLVAGLAGRAVRVSLADHALD
ncbi:MAG: protein kinase [Myxococcales bacterium]|nr:protein kinase [Myxococcales bacterium]